uniref:Spondin-1 n=1 Tax=Timema monikensis TaxID=170555 RepID=A0A7R9E5G9_9NEOP|nr:unnamed protein product [Timema monikensis]
MASLVLTDSSQLTSDSQHLVSLQGERNHHTSQKFTGFVLVVEPGVQTSPWEAPLSLPNVGTFSLLSDSLTRFNKKCPNSVMQAHYIPKSDIQVLWTAPPSGSGCVVFRSTVVEYNDVWYMDDGPLSLTLCEKVQETSQPEIVKTCCACDEAKYEVTFHGLWTRHTHPRHYPNNSFVTRFSDVIGASHTVDYRFWDYGEIASEGLQEVAEKGSTRMLESELKAMSEHIRTIIKARGISYPNITGKTFAVFRVDNKHHLMSLVSKITPSPDWIVGVAGLELCLRNCTWVKNKVLKLYPWDVGTDSGITYEAANSQTIPPEPIRQILTSSPNNPESPFYDPSGADMKPMAQLILTRQRLYEKSCADGEGPPIDALVIHHPQPRDCEVSRWEDRGHCSVTCGKGVRYQQRFYVDQKLAEMNNCQVPLTARKSCYGAQRVCRMDEDIDDVLRDPTCAVTEWAEWSSCSKECGRGVRTRVRKYQQAHARKRCAVKPGAPILEQTDECLGEEGPCEGEEENRPRSVVVTAPGYEPRGPGFDFRLVPRVSIGSTPSYSLSPSYHHLLISLGHGKSFYGKASELPQCEQMTEWSDWGPCSVTCGKGTRMRTRLLKASSEDLRMMVNMEAGDEEEGGEVASDEECDDRTVEEVQCEGDTSSCEFTEDQARKICQMTKDVGPCRLTTPPRWFFDKDSAACHKFSYGGCRGNSNNFLTKEECEQTCQDYRG